MYLITITFLITWGATLLYSFLVKGITYPLFAVIVMWIPGVVAWIYARKHSLKLISRPNKYYFIAPLIAIGIAFGTFKGFVSNPLVVTMLAMGAGLTVNMVAALGEELMWRGVLLEKLKHMTLLKSSLIIGTLWGVWHLPMILLLGHNYPSHPWIGSVMMVAMTIAMTPLMIFLRQKGRSVLVPAVFHGTINAVGPFLVLIFNEPSFLLVGIQGLAGVIVMAGVSAPLVFRYRERLVDQLDKSIRLSI